uniref:Thymidylate synthase n=1 Tax=Mimiviridae sp. ChoanoV1 TaxID=2596887 RepID=A0A5B8HVY0_9VIRU|nr:thymidylate synthase [Mimiviridae sp. ChoanoV1]
MKFSLIVATDKNLGIGKMNSLPWKLKSEMKYFRKTTSHLNSVVIMGRNTWESIPEKFKPLSGRINIILSSRQINIDGCERTFVADSLDNVIQIIDALQVNIMLGEVFIIGGQRLYQEVLKDNSKFVLDYIYQTEIYDDFNCDTYLLDKKEYKEKLKSYDLVKSSNFYNEFCDINQRQIYFRYIVYKKALFKNDSGLNVKVYYPLSFPPFKNEEEYQYLNILNKILESGLKREDRTGTGTLSVFGTHQEFNLRDTFPILTTKRMFLRGIFEELMLYLRGQTDNKILNEKGISIWDGNTSGDFLDKRGLSHYEEGDMGETYGFNFRHFGGEYLGCSHQYEKGKDGFDQLENLIHLIKNDPASRRMIISLWNPYTNHKAALPSCLCWYQFYVDTERNELHSQIYLRSSDFFLANNWNVCTGAILVHLLCNLEGINLTPGTLKVITGDTHLYLNHLEQVKENLKRTPRPFPKLLIRERKKNIEEFTYEDLILLGYNPYPGIKAEMSV